MSEWLGFQFGGVCQHLPRPYGRVHGVGFHHELPPGPPFELQGAGEAALPPLCQSPGCVRPTGPFEPPPPIPITHGPHAPAAILLRHEHVVLAAVLQTLDRLPPGDFWSVVAPWQKGVLHLSMQDYSLSNCRFFLRLCHLFPLKSGMLALKRRCEPPPQQTTLTSGSYAD